MNRCPAETRLRKCAMVASLPKTITASACASHSSGSVGDSSTRHRRDSGSAAMNAATSGNPHAGSLQRLREPRSRPRVSDCNAAAGVLPLRMCKIVPGATARASWPAYGTNRSSASASPSSAASHSRNTSAFSTADSAAMRSAVVVLTGLADGRRISSSAIREQPRGVSLGERPSSSKPSSRRTAKSPV